MSSYFFLEADKNSKNAALIDNLEEYSKINQTLVYVIARPLTDQKYSYKYSDALIVLSSKRKISIIDCGDNFKQYEEFIEDITEDIGSISDKYLYKEVVGRPRLWKKTLLQTNLSVGDIIDVNSFFKDVTVTDDMEIKKLDLLISLFIGSINDIYRVKEEIPTSLLDKVKQKIQLFDGDQTRFIYQKPEKKKIRIQGLSGTGKTELLLHKLKDLYINDPKSKIFFTCHNKILADNLNKRIPDFFNFMKVEQQIEWNRRLWCTNAWGSYSFPDSGAYRYICAFYKIPFNRYSYEMSFSKVCQLAIDDIKEKYKDEIHPALTYMFIDESQDFDESFVELCDLVTEKNVYIAGDIFQSIFDENISSTIEPDFLLGKCYRTDPKTLMFAHGLGMGLFEETKLRWLEEKEWKDCGYNVNIQNSKYYLSREPLKRFEDLDENFESIQIVEIKSSFSDTVVETIIKIIKENETVKAEDIGIILLDRTKDIYELADIIEIKIQKEFGWMVNKAYETKEKQPDTILISNRNNVKGLEFPFVICLTRKITDSPSYRNALYTMLTRSFIKSYFVTQPGAASGLTNDMYSALEHIISNKEMVIQEPSEEEKESIQTRFKYNLKNLSHYDLMMEIFNELNVEQKYHEILLQATQQMEMIESGRSTLLDFVKDNYKYIQDR
ncbi:MAG TPA: ATP-binding domain-containing protein [Saprospiraceae bacterium]|nr:ATP-binding domain-containing protein [Saprospiraceae bacterium]